MQISFDYDALPSLVQEYVDYLRSSNLKSDLTVRAYVTDLQMFFRYSKLVRASSVNAVHRMPFDEFNQTDIRDLGPDFIFQLTAKDATSFIAYCRLVRENQAAALARKTVSIKRFYRYLSLNGKYIKDNPMRDLESPRIPKRLPKYLSLDQSVDLLHCVDGEFRERDFCILTLFLNCGLRLSELVGLNLRDYHADHTMRVIGKGNKERTIYLNPACISALENYLRVRPADGLTDRSALFISRNHNRISVRAVQNIVEKFLKKAGLSDLGYSTHKLRHTAATLMYQYGHVDVLLLKEILGHENLSTTEIYTHVRSEQLQEAVNANPLGGVSPPPEPLDLSDNSDQEN